MSYLTRIKVDHRTAAQKRLQDSYAWHQALWKAFPQTSVRNFLYRIEHRDSGFLVYLLSEDEPTRPDWGTWETKTVSKSFLDYTTYRFQLCANPTRRYVGDGRGTRFEKSKRFVVADPDALKQWLLRKAEQCGFAIEEGSLQIGPPVNQPFYKNGRKGNHKRVEYQGVLHVTDPRLFQSMFKKGLGSAKAFGFGLLVLDPVQ